MLAHKLRRAVGGVSSLTFNTSAVSAASTITIPAGAAIGDLAVLFDQCFGGTTDVVPTDWTGIVTASNGGGGQARVRVSYKVLVGGDPGTSITGLNSTSEDKVMLVFTPDVAITTVTLSTWNASCTNLNPDSQSVTASGQNVPLVVLASTGIDAATAAFSTASPAFDATVATADADLLAGYKIYNSSPADHTVDAADLGSFNPLTSGYIIVR